LSAPDFLRARGLSELGVDHAFGTRASGDATPGDVAYAKQVHGTTLVRVPGVPGEREADALWTDAPTQAVGIYTADCVPILVAHASGRIVAAVHAGWRGSAARIAARSVRALAEATGCRPAELRAAIGPHIGPCCYEVDAPVIQAIPERSVFRPAARPSTRCRPVRAEPPAAGRRRCRHAAIERVGGCTACDRSATPATGASAARPACSTSCAPPR
jgi:YfiH family protein